MHKIKWFAAIECMRNVFLRNVTIFGESKKIEKLLKKMNKC